MGVIEDAANHERAYSIELCGGTHVRRTGDIGLIAIVGESAVAAGVRRIEAKTRDDARRRLTADSRSLADLAALLRSPPEEAAGRLEALIDDRRKLERELAEARRKLAMGGGSNGAEAVREVAGVKLYARAVTGVDMKDLKSLADEAKQSVGSGVVAIAATARGRQGEPRRRRDGRPDRPLQRHRSRPARLGRAGRQGRRRASRHGPGRRPGRRQGRGGAGRGRGGNQGAGLRRPRTNRAPQVAAGQESRTASGRVLGSHCAFSRSSIG